MSYPKRLRLAFIIITLICFSVARNVLAQDVEAKISDIMSKSSMGFAVPDAPAFKVLGADPSTLMRPQHTREVAVSLANILATGGGLPPSFGAEFSPAMLLAGKSLYFSNYRSDWLTPLLYRLRVSFATQRDAGGSSATGLGWGLKFTIVDRSDLRLDDAYTDKVYGMLDYSVKVHAHFIDSLKGNPSYFESKPEIEKKRINAEVESLTSDALGGYTEKLVTLRDSARINNWNKALVELGFAGACRSSDSLASHLLASKYAFWLSASFPLGTAGQLYLGGNASIIRGQTGIFDTKSASIAARAYAGNNLVKGYVEASMKTETVALPMTSVLIGGELKLTEQIWFEISFGFDKRSESDPHVTTNYNLKFNP